MKILTAVEPLAHDSVNLKKALILDWLLYAAKLSQLPTEEEQNRLDKMSLEELETLAKKRFSPKNYRELMQDYKVAESARNPAEVKHYALVVGHKREIEDRKTAIAKSVFGEDTQKN